MNRFNTFTSSIDISSHEAWFTSYASSERAREHGDASPMDLKRQHTMAVLANANRIVLDERFEPQISRACLLAALYHDVGRFGQYLQYHTFRDKESCNHGQMGVRILKKKNRLADEAPLIRKLVLTAVGMHNRFVLPAHISHTAALVTNVVRDADKLDILRIMEEHLNGPGPYNPTVVLQQPDDPTIAGEGILNAVRECRVASYADLRCVNDFRLLLGTWFYDLHFNTARKMFLEDGHALALLRGLPDNTPQAPLRDFLLQQLTTAGA
ncbi:MAG: HD domain-containing protein [Desulfovibrio sp.]|nr:HD domain-containing protein [Desulfovibrio sp.]